MRTTKILSQYRWNSFWADCKFVSGEWHISSEERIRVVTQSLAPPHSRASVLNDSFSRERSCLEGRESLGWRCEAETVVWSHRWWCQGRPTLFPNSLRFAKQLLFKEVTIQHVFSKPRAVALPADDFRGQWLSLINTLAERMQIWRGKKRDPRRSLEGPHRKSRSSFPVSPTCSHCHAVLHHQQCWPQKPHQCTWILQSSYPPIILSNSNSGQEEHEWFGRLMVQINADGRCLGTSAGQLEKCFY